jgi:hypothetical protein
MGEESRRHGEMRKYVGMHKTCVGKHGRTKPLRRHGCIWENNIKICYKDVGFEDVWWPKLAEDVDQCELLSTWLEFFFFPPEVRILSQKGLLAP